MSKLKSSTDAPRGFRRLKWNELVSAGDFIMAKSRELELWEGPNGFRADAFVDPIYRRNQVKGSVPDIVVF